MVQSFQRGKHLKKEKDGRRRKLKLKKMTTLLINPSKGLLECCGAFTKNTGLATCF
jgi:hypothetical protein